jgi:hypothetical protein
MAIRLRTVGAVRVALCAVESDAMPGDVYLDDAEHYALAAKFAQDFQAGPQYKREWCAMASQKVRDAREEHARWEAAGRPESEQVTAPSLSGTQGARC